MVAIRPLLILGSVLIRRHTQQWCVLGTCTCTRVVLESLGTCYITATQCSCDDESKLFTRITSLGPNKRQKHLIYSSTNSNGKCNLSSNSKQHTFFSGSHNRFYPNVTTLRSGLCYRKSVCRLSVCNVGAPYSGGWNFRQYFLTAVYAGHPLTSVQKFTEIVTGKLLRRGR